MQILPAQRKRLKARIGISGTSGSGKTYSALLLAYGITGDYKKICVIDTEVWSSNNYAHLGEFRVLEISAPFSPEKFIEAIKICENAGMEAIIIDSVSHEWEGMGGCLEINDALARSKFKGNTWAAWSETTPRHQKFIEAITQSTAHIIATSRSKTDTAIIDGKPKKIGTKDIQREGFEYELTLVFHLDRDTHKAIANKDRTGVFIDRDPFLINENIGKEFGAWLEAGIDPKEIEAEKKPLEEEKKRKIYENYIERLSATKTIPELQGIFEEIKTRIKDLEKPMLDDLVERVKAIKIQLERAQKTEESKPEETEAAILGTKNPDAIAKHFYNFFLKKIRNATSAEELEEITQKFEYHQGHFIREDKEKIQKMLTAKMIVHSYK